MSATSPATLNLRAFAPGAFSHQAQCLECVNQRQAPDPVVVTIRVPIRYAPKGGASYSYVDLCQKHLRALMAGAMEIIQQPQSGGANGSSDGGGSSERSQSTGKASR